mmetsp:Transcript_53145/g.116614  ORF Transcript_53145/g.116614 Transcript_53145/m.116614 type:complete len:228 (+) Transcript_53145:2-685(+)
MPITRVAAEGGEVGAVRDGGGAGGWGAAVVGAGGGQGAGAGAGQGGLAPRAPASSVALFLCGSRLARIRTEISRSTTSCHAVVDLLPVHSVASRVQKQWVRHDLVVIARARVHEAPPCRGVPVLRVNSALRAIRRSVLRTIAPQQGGPASNPDPRLTQARAASAARRRLAPPRGLRDAGRRGCPGLALVRDVLALVLRFAVELGEQLALPLPEGGRVLRPAGDIAVR